MVAGDQRLIHTPFVPSGYWSPCAPLVWNQGFPTPLGGPSVSTNPVKAPDIRFSSSQFRKQHPRHEKAVSRTSLAEAIYAWPCESISRGRADSPHSRPYQGIWGQVLTKNWLYLYLSYHVESEVECDYLTFPDLSLNVHHVL